MLKRKWVVVGLALVAIGVGAYLFSQPRKGSVEYHKKKYLKAHETGPVGEWIMLHAPMAVYDLYWRPRERRIDFHRNALLEAGYLVQREFVVSNRLARDIRDDLHRVRFDVFTDTNDFAGTPLFYRAGTNKVRVVARAIDIDKWDDAVRRFDVPEEK